MTLFGDPISFEEDESCHLIGSGLKEGSITSRRRIIGLSRQYRNCSRAFNFVFTFTVRGYACEASALSSQASRCAGNRRGATAGYCMKNWCRLRSDERSRKFYVERISNIGQRSAVLLCTCTSVVLMFHPPQVDVPISRFTLSAVCRSHLTLPSQHRS